MNKPLSEKEISALQVPGPVKIEPMTRREKLYRWADRLDHIQQNLVMYRGLEYMQPALRDPLPITGTAFAVAVTDPILAEAGLQGATTVGQVCTFMELTANQMHVFACSCGGELSNEAMAERIRYLGDNPSWGL